MKLQNSEVIDQNNSDTIINEPESTRLIEKYLIKTYISRKRLLMIIDDLKINIILQ